MSGELEPDEVADLTSAEPVLFRWSRRRSCADSPSFRCAVPIVSSLSRPPSLQLRRRTGDRVSLRALYGVRGLFAESPCRRDQRTLPRRSGGRARPHQPSLGDRQRSRPLSDGPVGFRRRRRDSGTDHPADGPDRPPLLEGTGRGGAHRARAQRRERAVQVRQRAEDLHAAAASGAQESNGAPQGAGWVG